MTFPRVSSSHIPVSISRSNSVLSDISNSVAVSAVSAISAAAAARRRNSSSSEAGGKENEAAKGRPKDVVEVGTGKGKGRRQ